MTYSILTTRSGASLFFESSTFTVGAVTDELDWMDESLCAQIGTEMFFPEKGGSTRDAKRICGDCPVAKDCLAYALEHDERFGIWGGKSERERRKLAKEARS